MDYDTSYDMFTESPSENQSSASKLNVLQNQRQPVSSLTVASATKMTPSRAKMGEDKENGTPNMSAYRNRRKELTSSEEEASSDDDIPKQSTLRRHLGSRKIESDSEDSDVNNLTSNSASNNEDGEPNETNLSPQDTSNLKSVISESESDEDTELSVPSHRPSRFTARPKLSSESSAENEEDLRGVTKSKVRELESDSEDSDSAGSARDSASNDEDEESNETSLSLQKEASKLKPMVSQSDSDEDNELAIPSRQRSFNARQKLPVEYLSAESSAEDEDIREVTVDDAKIVPCIELDDSIRSIPEVAQQPTKPLAHVQKTPTAVNPATPPAVNLPRDPITTQSPVFLKLDGLDHNAISQLLQQKRRMFNTVNVQVLPDKGAKLRLQVDQLEAALASMSVRAKEPTGDQAVAGMSRIEPQVLPSSTASLPKPLNANAQPYQLPGWVNQGKDTQKQMYAPAPAANPLYGARGGIGGAGNKIFATNVTTDALQSLHESLLTCPQEDESEQGPEELLVDLMAHQERALKWLMWRETQNPPGGILADDMGLGKTLTMLSLILKYKRALESVDKRTLTWNKKGGVIKSDATLVVCPASLIGQWEKEIVTRFPRKSLTYFLYHGPNRTKEAHRLHKYDVVITTYQIIANELGPKDAKKSELRAANDENAPTNSTLASIGWCRVVLDEAHIIRNPQSITSQGTCRLRAGRRWAVTGTPIQNKETDLYSLLRFLRCSPFDEYQVWKRWVESKSAQSQERMKLIVKCLILRRTKEQTCSITGKTLVALPPKQQYTHRLALAKDEKHVYDQLHAMSAKAIDNYMVQQAEKEGSGPALYARTGGGGAGARHTNIVPTRVKQCHLLVLLLRLRQACCHPALLKTMIENDGKLDEGLEEPVEQDSDDDLDLVNRLASMSVTGAKGNTEEEEEEKDFFRTSNPVFKRENVSSKISLVLKELKKVSELGHKSVIVSQWTSFLDLLEPHVKRAGFRCCAINGSIPVKDRQPVVEDFNSNERGANVLLLSLCAGGVGLNLVGGNHLFLLDMHWNPQLEAQACDRIYRVGQVREVHIHRFAVENTVEMRILELQEKKLALATSVLTGTKRSAQTKLSMDELLALFK